MKIHLVAIVPHAIDIDKTESAHDVTRGIVLSKVALIRRLASSRGGLPNFAMLPDGSIASDDTCPRGPPAPCPHHALLSRHESSQSAHSCHSSTTTGSGPQPTSPLRNIRNVHMANTPVHEARGSGTIRQHYYPEGGWGWLITACVFMVHVLTTGMQLSYGILLVEIVRHFGSEYITEAGWLGVMSLAISLFLAPFVVAFCRRKSTRLTAIFGGLIMALACLFTSFAQQMHQVFFSYGVVMGIGVGLTRETSNLMVGQYFKRRREFIEIIVQSGGGIGIALFSVFLKECINSIGWRLGLQAVTGTLFLCFILGIFYRSASLYHPQRRAILHLKSQKRKIKDKSKKNSDKPPYCDFTALRTRTLQIIMLSAATSALGLYTPLFFLMLQGTEEGLEASTLILLQTFVGFAFAVGCVAFGLVVVRQSEQCMISRQYLCQTSLFGLGISILALTAVQGYHGYVLFVWIYGIFLGGYHYTLKMFTLERARARFFSRAWGFVQWAQAVPVLIGVPISGYINESSYGPKSGYYLSCTFTLAGASSLFLLNLYKRSVRRQDATVSFGSVESRGSSSAIPQLDDDDDEEDDAGNTHRRHDPRLAKSISFATSVDVIDEKRPDCLTCISEEGLAALDDMYGREEITSCNKVEKYLLISEYKNNLMEEARIDQPTPSPPPPPLSILCPAHGVPEESELVRTLPCRISQRHRPRRSITVVEEMTTSV